MKVNTVYCFHINRNMIFWNKILCFLILFIKFEQITSYRLPNTLTPEKYDLKIITYLDEGGEDDFTFVGRVKIKVTANSQTKNITLNAKDLKILSEKTSVKSLSSDNKDIEILKGEIDDENEFYIMHLKDPLKESEEYEIKLDFEGSLSDNLLGYYRSSYENYKTGTRHWLAITQFEPTDARRAFPCFDEPKLKAKFSITLGHNKKYTSISNMPLIETKEMKDRKHWVWDIYEESVKMSTYLVAYAVTDFGFRENTNGKSKTNFKIWARNEALDQTEFAKEVGPEALNFFENYFKIAYPLPKQDMIAIPDFSTGAMENWGLITYRETSLLYDDKTASAQNKQRIASVICHELAHQWFGNLVTMKWWTDLWLNEGFATYMATLCVHDLFPKWNSLKSDSVTNLLRVYDLDSLKSSHPVSVPIKHTNEISEIFDTISYKKGSFIIRMMDLFLGQNVLRKGVSNYLKKHEYDNAAQDDLWEALTKQAHHDHTLPQNLTVKEIMDTWTLQTGYPLINVHRDYKNAVVEISQERYFKAHSSNNKQTHKDDKSCWRVPITYTTQMDKNFNSTKPKMWLSCPKQTDIIEGPPENSWIIFNIRASALYKVNYDEINWKMLIHQLKENFHAINVLNRVLLIENSMDLASTGHLSYSLTFDLISYVKYETEYIALRTAFSKLGLITAYLKRTPNFGLLKMYKRYLVASMYEKVGGLKVDPEKRNSLDAISHQVLVAREACFSGVPKCVHDAEKMFKSYMNNPEKSHEISQDMRFIVYCKGIELGDEDEWNFLYDKYKKSNVGTEKASILGALACTDKVWLLARYLHYAVGEDPAIRNQDTNRIFASVASNSVGYYVAKAFFEDNIDKIYKWNGSKKSRMGEFVKVIADKIMTVREQKEFLAFIENNKQYLEISAYGIQQSLEEIEVNIEWHKKYYKVIEGIFKSKIQN